MAREVKDGSARKCTFWVTEGRKTRLTKVCDKCGAYLKLGMYHSRLAECFFGTRCKAQGAIRYNP